MPSATDARHPLASLRATLRTAEGLITGLATDPLFARLVRVFAAMPEDERGVILDVLEREVDARRTTLAGGAFPGARPVRPNPNARLYLRVSDGDDGTNLTRTEVIQATIRAVRIMTRTGPALAGEASAAVADAVRGLDETERAALVHFHEEMLALLGADAR